jgi:hypothetical protein
MGVDSEGDAGLDMDSEEE